MASTKNTKKTWLKKVNIPIYDGDLWITVGESVSDACKFANIKCDEPDAFVAGCFRDGGGRYALVFSRNNLKHSVIAHECLHATFRISERGGWGHNAQTIEPFSYLHEWITSEVYKALQKHEEAILCEK
jgi:hypothetical protein